jgi:hypothetical protein
MFANYATKKPKLPCASYSEIYMNEKTIAAIIAKVKEKKELVNLDTQFCKEIIEKVIAQNPKARAKIADNEFDKIKKSKEIDLVVKETRRQIRNVYGLFQTADIVDAEKVLEKLIEALKQKKSATITELTDELLSCHVSTKERLPTYSEFYKKIFAVTGKPKKIFEIGAGFNPFSYPYMETDAEYVATELNNNDVDLVNKYFSAAGVNGKAIRLDVRVQKADEPADIMFAFKLFDLVDNKVTERVVTESRVKWIVASFPTRTVTDAPMNQKRRAGFQKMLRRLRMKYQTIEFGNELLYIINTTKYL